MIMLGVFLTFFYSVLSKVGPIFLFFALILGIVGLPIPDELLLIGSGFLIANHKINLAATVACAILGSMCGITISYFLGRLVGGWIIHKYGRTLNLTPEKLEFAKKWFARIGKWTLVFGYYIPFFRHLFGFVAGGAKLNFKQFALFAYSGATLWCLTFLSLGYFFHHWFTELFPK